MSVQNTAVETIVTVGFDPHDLFARSGHADPSATTATDGGTERRGDQITGLVERIEPTINIPRRTRVNHINRCGTDRLEEIKPQSIRGRKPIERPVAENSVTDEAAIDPLATGD